jgi:hypothetical protein
MIRTNIYGGPDFENEDFELKGGKASHIPTFAARKCSQSKHAGKKLSVIQPSALLCI